MTVIHKSVNHLNLMTEIPQSSSSHNGSYFLWSVSLVSILSWVCDPWQRLFELEKVVAAPATLRFAFVVLWSGFDFWLCWCPSSIGRVFLSCFEFLPLLMTQSNRTSWVEKLLVLMSQSNPSSVVSLFFLPMASLVVVYLRRGPTSIATWTFASRPWSAQHEPTTILTL